MTPYQDGVRKSDVALEPCANWFANSLFATHHYLHRPRVGRLLAYRVMYQSRAVGGLLFARPMVCSPMFGYPPNQIVELARVWFSEHPKNLGSCAIRKAVKSVPKDWMGTAAIISWCDTTRFDGALYKASGFEYMGTSRPRGIGGGRPDRKVHNDRRTVKDVYLIRLARPIIAVAPTPNTSTQRMLNFSPS